MADARTSAGPAGAKTSEGKAAQVEDMVAPAVVAMGYDIVRVLLCGGRRPRLQIMAERRDGRAMELEDCAAISRAIAPILDVGDPIVGSYELEVSSPGIDRPLTRLGDFDRFAGCRAKLETAVPIDGRRRFTGRLGGTRGERVTLETDTGEVAMPFSLLIKAKLLLTDDLIATDRRAPGPDNQGTE